MASDKQQLPLPLIRDSEPRLTASYANTSPHERRDPASMTVAELLAAVLGPSREPICAELTATYGGLRRLAGVHPAEFRERGLSRGVLDRLSAVFEIARRFGEEEFVPGQPFKGSYDISSVRLKVEQGQIVSGVRWSRLGATGLQGV